MRRNLRIICALWGGVLAAAIGAAEEPYIGPYIQGLRHDSVVIRWESEAKCVGEVDIGESDTALRTVKEAEARVIHEVPVPGLRADTRYVYRVRWDGKSTGLCEMRTMPPDGTRRFRLAAYGDSRSNPPVHAEIVRRMLAMSPDLVINTGDLVADGTKKDNWKPQFFDPLKPLFARTPVITCMGNHERDSGLYYDYFTYPGNEAWFSYRWANVHFIVLDSQKPYDPGSEQYKWLEKELQGPDADWRIAFFHYPMFSCHPTRDVNGNRWAWQDLFDRHGVDVVFTGHDHYYHRSHRIGRAWDPASRGVYHITSGGGGATLYEVEPKVYSAQARSIHHFMILDFDGNRATGTVIGVDGAIIDSFVIDRGRPEPGPFVSYEVVLWEKALADAADKLEPERLDFDGGTLERRFALPAFSKQPHSIGYRWIGGSSFWAAGGSEGIVEAKGGEPFEVLLRGEGPARSMYPLPSLELSVVKGPPGGRDFVNRVVDLPILKFATNRTVSATRLRGRVRVDGVMDEEAWRDVQETRGFTRSFGRTLSDRESFFVGYDGEGLVIGVKVRTLTEKPLAKGAKDRDTRNMYRTDEAVTFMLTSPTIYPVTYFLSGNSRGTRFDSLANVLAWNPEWEYAVSEMPGGWQAEARIPWAVLGLREAPVTAWQANFFRWDTGDKALSEWAPTFSAYGTQRKYDGSLVFERLAAGR